MQQMYSPMAQAVQSRGRGEDTMLVHMTPGEVGGLQQLAMASGGSLTINPDTGLPEAGWLGRLLPTIIGAGLAATGVGAPLAAAMVGAGSTAITGDIGKGLMAGLGAFGGAGLAGAAGLGSSIGSGNGLGLLSDKAGFFGSNMGAGVTAGVPTGAASSLVPEVAPQVAPQAIAEPTARYATEQVLSPLTMDAANLGATGVTPAATATGAAPTNLIPSTFGSTGAVPSNIVQTAMVDGGISTAFEPTAPGFLQRFGDITQIPGAPPIANKVLPFAAGYAALAPALTPEYKAPEDEEEEPTYQMRYQSPEFAPSLTDAGRYASSEAKYFNPGVATPIGYGDEPYYLAEGDEVPAPRGVGATLAAQLPQYTRAFQTSPGAVTGVPFGYGQGQSPSELIRADIARQAAERQAAAAEAAAAEQQADMSTMPATPGGEYMFGVPKTDPSQRLTGNAYGSYFSNFPSYFNFGYPYASGGTVEMESGGFVMPARETAEFGNGSTVAGQQTLAGLGGLPIRGKGDGVSDSIPAMIDGQQRAALANGETYFPPQAVKRLGGADKLRNMMQAATRSRQNAPRGGLNTIRGRA